jgi:hypothetical protein
MPVRPTMRPATLLADFRFGFQPDRVTIVADGDTLGCSGTAYHPLGQCETADDVERFVISILAGYAADIRFGTDEAAARAGASNDFERAEVYLPDCGQTMETLIAKAHRFVEQNWKAIQAVAAQLMEYRTLDDTELEFIIKWADTEDANELESLARYRLMRDWPRRIRASNPKRKFA